MPIPGDAVAQRTLIYLLAGGGVLTYVASKAAVDAIVGKSLATPRRLAVGHWVSPAVVTLVAMAIGRPDVAVSLVFATSVVCLTLGVGALLTLGHTIAAGERRSASVMLLPITLAAFLAGLHGTLTLTHAGALALLGVIAVSLWSGPNWNDTPKLATARRGHAATRIVQLLLAAALAGVGGWAAIRGISGVHPSNGIATPGLLTVTLLAPLLVLPALGTGMDLAYKNRAAVAYDGLIGLVLLNLCVLLPVCTVEANLHLLQRSVTTLLPPTNDAVSVAVPTSEPLTGASSRPTTAASQPAPPDTPAEAASTDGLIFPRTSWRVDAVALVVLAVLLLPIGLGRWPLTLGDGIGLILAYLVYVAVAVVLQVQG